MVKSPRCWYPSYRDTPPDQAELIFRFRLELPPRNAKYHAATKKKPINRWFQEHLKANGIEWFDLLIGRLWDLWVEIGVNRRTWEQCAPEKEVSLADWELLSIPFYYLVQEISLSRDIAYEKYQWPCSIAWVVSTGYRVLKMSSMNRQHVESIANANYMIPMSPIYYEQCWIPSWRAHYKQ